MEIAWPRACRFSDLTYPETRQNDELFKKWFTRCFIFRFSQFVFRSVNTVAIHDILKRFLLPSDLKELAQANKEGQERFQRQKWISRSSDNLSKKNWLLWWEIHFQVKQNRRDKTRSLFGRWTVEKWLRSIFFWNLFTHFLTIHSLTQLQNLPSKATKTPNFRPNWLQKTSTRRLERRLWPLVPKSLGWFSLVVKQWWNILEPRSTVISASWTSHKTENKANQTTQTMPRTEWCRRKKKAADFHAGNRARHCTLKHGLHSFFFQVWIQKLIPIIISFFNFFEPWIIQKYNENHILFVFFFSEFFNSQQHDWFLI